MKMNIRWTLKIGWNSFPRISTPRSGNFRAHILLNQRRRNRGMAAMTSITVATYIAPLWSTHSAVQEYGALGKRLEDQIFFFRHWITVVKFMHVYCQILVHPSYSMMPWNSFPESYTSAEQHTKGIRLSLPSMNHVLQSASCILLLLVIAVQYISFIKLYFVLGLQLPRYRHNQCPCL